MDRLEGLTREIVMILRRDRAANERQLFDIEDTLRLDGSGGALQMAAGTAVDARVILPSDLIARLRQAGADRQDVEMQQDADDLATIAAGGMLEKEPQWMRDRLVPECAGDHPEPLDSSITEMRARELAEELRRRLYDVKREEALAELDAHMRAGHWLAAIGVSASLCLRGGIRVPFTIMDFQDVVSCDVHNAILDDLECVTHCKFIEPDPGKGQV